jgi:integrase/recombinase XerD
MFIRTDRHDDLDVTGHGPGRERRAVSAGKEDRTDQLDEAITPDGTYKVVCAYSAAPGFEIGAHALRATTAANALDHQADIAKDSPTFKAAY